MSEMMCCSFVSVVFVLNVIVVVVILVCFRVDACCEAVVVSEIHAHFTLQRNLHWYCNKKECTNMLQR